MNLRLALRSLVRTPLVTTIAVLSLGLGIGANAAIFSLFDRIVLQPIPVHEPDRLVNLLSPGPKPGTQSSTGAGDSETLFSYPMLRDLQRAQAPFVGIAAHRMFSANLRATGEAIHAEGSLVTGNYFELLGLQPAAGRLFRPEDDTTPGGHPIVVLSFRYWQSQYQGSASAIDQSIVVNGKPMTIVGVAPRGFLGTTLGQEPKLYVPLTMHASMVPGWSYFENRRAYWLYAFARLAPDTTLEQAQTAINVPYSSILQQVELPLQSGMSDATKTQFAAKRIVLEPGRRGQSEVLQDAKAPLFMLIAVTILVLLLACANIANLLLNKALSRAGEIAVRLSIGAQRRHLIGQLLTESFVLAAMGGLLGFWVARATLGAIVAMLPAEIASSMHFELGPATWLFLAVLSALTGLLGLFPAWHSTRTGLAGVLRSQGGRGSRSKGANRFRAVMATTQIALSTALLISSGLFIQSLRNVSRADLGIQIEQLATFHVSPQLNGYEPAQARALFEQLEHELAALPGVRSTSAALVPLINGSSWGVGAYVQGFPSGPDINRYSAFNEVGPDYFSTLGVPLLEGRSFEDRDTLESPKVAIVNQAFATKFGLGADVLGKRLTLNDPEHELDTEIVGLVPDTKYSDVKRAAPPLVFIPYRQDATIRSASFYVLAQADPAELLPSMRGVVERLDPNLPVENLRTMPQQIERSVFIDRLMSILSAAFALLATLLAGIGLYGVVAYSTSQRTREIGLRMAMGADGSRVRRLVLRQVLWMTLPGAALGVFAAFGLGRLARSILFEMRGTEPAIFALGTVLLVLVAMLAGTMPAVRAARIDPILALREE